MGLFDKLKQGLTKTWKSLNTDVRDLFKSQGRLVDEAFLEELLGILIKTDMGVQAAQAIVDEVSVKFRARVVEIANVGHAPTLLHEDQIGVLREFLLESAPDARTRQ